MLGDQRRPQTHRETSHDTGQELAPTIATRSRLVPAQCVGTSLFLFRVFARSMTMFALHSIGVMQAIPQMIYGYKSRFISLASAAPPRVTASQGSVRRSSGGLVVVVTMYWNNGLPSVSSK